MSSSNIEITRKAYPWGRAYIVEGASEAPLILPSVTTVLKLLKNEKYEMLRKQFGDKRWDKILHDAAKFTKYVDKGRDLFWNFYHDKFWENILEVVDNEAFLYTTFKGGWAGACDFVYRDLEHNLIVEDFKSSTSLKDEEDILSYKLQIAAYMFMCAEKYNEVPKVGKIRIANEQTSDIQTFEVHDYELKDYLSQFIDLCEKFREINNI